MGMNMTRRFFTKAAAATLALSTPSVLGGCDSASNASSSSASNTAAEAGPLTVCVWDEELLCDLVPYLHAQMPDADIELIAGNNDVDLYSYFLEHDALPDIITVRRFAGTEAADLRAHLIDFASYDVASEFTAYSLQYYKNNDGEVNWLPVCGIPQTIIANKTLFDEQGLQLPQCYDDYVQVCQAFYDADIKPYALDLAQDWSSHEMVQAGGIGELTSLDGLSWRAQAESAQEDIAFDDELWNSIFTHTATLLNDSHFTTDDLAVDTATAMQLFVEGKAAMFHGSPSHLKQCREQMDAELVRLPYFSQTSSEGYIYMTPSVHIAMNKNLEDNSEKLECAMKVLEHMLSVDGQKLIASGSSVISFNPGIASITDGMTGLEDEIEGNQFYIRYASQKSFTASVKAVSGLLTETMSAAQAYEAFKDAINSSDAQAASIVTFENEYSLALNDRSGRDAASSILTTVKEQLGAQLALAPYYHFASSIYRGECTENRLSLMIANKSAAASLYLVSLTGAQIQKLIEGNLAGTDGDFCPECAYELPIASGMKLVVEPNGSGFALKDMLVDGASIETKKTYTVLLTDGVASGLEQTPEVVEDQTLATAWVQAVRGGQQPSAPEDYIEVRK